MRSPPHQAGGGAASLCLLPSSRALQDTRRREIGREGRESKPGWTELLGAGQGRLSFEFWWHAPSFAVGDALWRAPESPEQWCQAFPSAHCENRGGSPSTEPASCRGLRFTPLPHWGPQLSPPPLLGIEASGPRTWGQAPLLGKRHLARVLTTLLLCSLLSLGIGVLFACILAQPCT